MTVELTWTGPGGFTIITADGEIDLTTVDPFRKALEQSTDHGGPVIVDLSRVGFMSMAGFRCLSHAHAITQQYGAAVHLVHRSTGPVALVMRVSRLDQEFPVHADLDAALDSLG